MTNQRLIRLVWKKRISRKRRETVTKFCGEFGKVRNYGDSMFLTMPRGDMKAIWLFMLLNCWSEIMLIMNEIQPRYDEKRGIYRDCRWCHGRGCVYCPAEADKEYKRQFPDGPQPIATFSIRDIEGGAIGLFKKILSPDAVMAAKAEGKKRAEKIIEKNPAIPELANCSKEQAIEVLGQNITGDVIQENIIKLANENPRARRFVNKKYLIKRKTP